MATRVPSLATAVVDPDFKLELPRAALVVTDPQVDFLSPSGLAWGVVGESVERMERFAALTGLRRDAVLR